MSRLAWALVAVVIVCVVLLALTGHGGPAYDEVGR